MKNSTNMNLFATGRAYFKIILIGTIAVVLAACASGNKATSGAQIAGENGTAGQASNRWLTPEQERAALARQTEEARKSADEARQQKEAAEIATREAQRQTEVEQNARVEQERLALERANVENQRREEASALQAKQTRVAALERQLVVAREKTKNVAAANAKMEEATAAAEELLRVLMAEQNKYSTTSPSGQPVEALEKERIADLEARKNNLKREAQALSQ